MAANNVPIFTNVGVVGIGQLSVANTGFDGTGTLVTVATGSTNGTLITLIRVVATGTTTAGLVNFFINNGGERYYASVSVTAITPSATLAPFVTEYTPTTPLVLPSGYILKAAPTKAETFNVLAIGGNY